MSIRNTSENEAQHGVAFWFAVAVGGTLIVFGIRGAILEATATGPGDLFVWIVGADLIHDLLIAPAVCAVGWIITRTVPEPWRSPLRAALVLTAIAIVVGWPALRGYGRDHVPDNPTVQPLDYASAMLTVLLVVWVGSACWALVRLIGSRRHRE